MTEFTETAHDRLVISELAVAAKFDELVDQTTDVVDEVRSLRVAGDLGLLPGVEMGIGFQPHSLYACAQRHDLRVEGSGSGRLEKLRKLIDLGFELRDRALEFQIVRGHGVVSGPTRKKARKLGAKASRSKFATTGRPRASGGLPRMALAHLA